jgi:peroxiredoxin
MRRPSSTLIWIGVGAVAAVAAFALARHAAMESPEPLAVGTAAPEFTLRGTTGERVAFAPPVARPVVLAFVSTGCAHCERTAPELVALARRGTTVLAIDAGASSDDERHAFARDTLAGAVPFLADPGGGVSRRYKASATPTVYVLRPDGRVAAVWIGEAPMTRFETALTAARG